MNTRSKGRQRSQKRSQRGGSQGSYPDSAWGFQMNNLGDGLTQFRNSLTGDPNNQSNVIVQNHTKMNGGKRRRCSRGKRGGYFGAVLEQAAVPLALLGSQQYYGKRRTRKQTGRNKSFRRRH
jgi:hypothetical protein